MPLSKSWEHVAKEQPDARARESRNEKKHKLLGWMEEVFCVNCGRPHGMITRESAAYVFCICDECVKKFGRPPTVFEEVEPGVVSAITRKD